MQSSDNLEPNMRIQMTYSTTTLFKLAKFSSVIKFLLQRKLSKKDRTATKKNIGLGDPNLRQCLQKFCLGVQLNNLKKIVRQIRQNSACPKEHFEENCFREKIKFAIKFEIFGV